MTKAHHNEWAEAYEILKPNHKVHAGYFSWETDRSAAELGVLEVFARIEGRSFFAGARPRGANNDPPDCEAISLTGKQIGIEISELVDPVSAAKARAGDWYASRDWIDDLIPELEKIIQRKDVPSTLKGGPYSEYVLLIHADEELDLAQAQHVLSKHAFRQTQLITRAYLLFSHNLWETARDLQEKQYLCIRLKISNGRQSDATYSSEQREKSS